LFDCSRYGGTEESFVERFGSTRCENLVCLFKKTKFKKFIGFVEDKIFDAVLA
jgi:hypothetical protein